MTEKDKERSNKQIQKKKGTELQRQACSPTLLRQNGQILLYLERAGNTETQGDRDRSERLRNSDRSRER